MAKPISLIRDITPTTPRPWTAKVLVVEKSLPRDARDSPVKYLKLAIVDEAGGKVQLALFNTNISMFKGRLQLHKKYYITNAKVQNAPLKYLFGTTVYQWSLDNSCLVEEVIDDEDAPPIQAYNFVDSAEIVNNIDSTSTIDLLVIALRVLPKKQVNTKTTIVDLQEVIVIDRSMHPFVLTFWDQFVKEDALNLAAIIDQKPIFSSAPGVTVNSRSGSNYLINPAIPDAVELRTWLYDNITDVNGLLNSNDLIATACNFGKEVTGAIVSVSAIGGLTHLRLFNVKATITLATYTQNFVYMTCNSCTGKTSAAYNEIYTCNHCGTPAVVSSPRMRAEVNVCDSTGRVTATLTGPNAETFLSCSVDVLHQNSLLAKPCPVETLINPKDKESVYVQLRAYVTEYLGVTSHKFGATLKDPPVVVNQLEPPPVARIEKVLPLSDQSSVFELDDPDLTSTEKLMLKSILDRKKMKSAAFLPSTSIVTETVLKPLAVDPVLAIEFMPIIEEPLIEDRVLPPEAPIIPLISASHLNAI